ncbi:hypothetical protein D8L93_02175 [Sodalis-like symbiont of Bactericera trigonica]|nr:hypothetical protein D8L93_02175 [Sodalis-like symbiont of Bactericera trigonica]
MQITVIVVAMVAVIVAIGKIGISRQRGVGGGDHLSRGVIQKNTADLRQVAHFCGKKRVQMRLLYGEQPLMSDTLG